MKKYKVLSLFAGCGGLDLGFRGGFSYLGKKYSKSKFSIEWANDYDKDACLTYRYNFNHDIICGDIRDILKSPENYHLPKEVDIVLGGFPCQDFSHAGKRMGFNAARGNLYKSMLEVVDRTQPMLFIAENVKGLTTMNNGEALNIIISDFAKLGYNVSYKLHLTADYGVPQFRERVIIIGTRKDILPTFPQNLFEDKKQKWVSLGEAIGDLEHVKEKAFPNHMWSKAKKNKGQGNSTVEKDKPGPTMRAEHHGNIEFHWNNTRRLSAREAARIQSFPDDFLFLPSTSKAYKQVGNAVPPVFAWNVAKVVEGFLDSNLSIEYDLYQKQPSYGERLLSVA